MSLFYIICPPKLENLLLIELKAKFKNHFPDESLGIIEVTPGGIEIECKLECGLLLNNILRGAGRILLRIKTQKCRDLPKLYNIIKKINWREFVCSENIKFKVTYKESRLNMEKRILSSAQSGFKDYFLAQPLKKNILEKYKDSPANTVFLRIFKDELNISIDTSGDLLHIRGDRSFRGHASLRENIASLLLTHLYQEYHPEDHTLIDPMCGTGTFLFEKLKANELLERSFQYEYFNPKTLSPLKDFKDKLLNTKLKNDSSIKFKGFDIDEQVVSKNKSSHIDFSTQNLFTSLETIEGCNMVICNPPFGKRVKIKGDKLDFFKSISLKIKELYKPKAYGIIIPRDFVGKLPGDRLYFNLNGIEVCFLTEKL